MNTYRRGVQQLKLISLWSWGLMAFCLPFSTALTMLFSTIGVALALLTINWEDTKKVLHHPLAFTSILLFSWLFLSTLWSVAPSEELLEGILKYRKLLYIPFVATLILANRDHPYLIIKCFIAGTTLVVLGSLSASSGILEYLIGPQSPGGGWKLGGDAAKHWFYIGAPENPTFGRAWIAQSAFVVFSIMWLLGYYLEATERGVTTSKERFIFILMFAVGALHVIALLNLGGRTGYALMIIGTLLWAALIYRARSKVLTVILLVFSLIIIVHTTKSEKIVNRVQEAVSDIVDYGESEKLTSQGIRLTFWKFGIIDGALKPFLGWGVGSYAERFSLNTDQPQELLKARAQPHSEYINIFHQGGLIGLLLLLFIKLKVVDYFYKDYRSLANPNFLSRISLIIICLLLLFDGFINSVIWDAGEGHAFAIFFGTLVAVSLKKSDSITTQKI